MRRSGQSTTYFGNVGVTLGLGVQTPARQIGFHNLSGLNEPGGAGESTPPAPTERSAYGCRPCDQMGFHNSSGER